MLTTFSQLSRNIMATIDLTDKVKERLKEYMDKKGCKTYSECVNLLLEFSGFHDETLNSNQSEK